MDHTPPNNQNESDGFILVQSRKEKRKERRAALPHQNSKKYVICPYLMKGHCRHELDGLRSFGNKNRCCYHHPRVCSRLLYYGVGGEAGC